MKTKIKKRLTRWSLQLKEVFFRVASMAIPIHQVRRAHLRASYNLQAEIGEWFKDVTDPGDVYNGHDFEWSRRALPPIVADKLLAEHDAKIEKENGNAWDFKELLERNIKLKH